MQRLEVDAGRQFADVGLDAVARDDAGSDAQLLAHVGDGTAWIAERDDAPVAYALASVVDGEAHLEQVSVDPSQRGRRVGATLVERVVEWARERGDRAVTLTTFVDVPWNAPYYARLGFEILPEKEWGPELHAIRAREAWLDALQPRVVMRRRL